LDKGKGYVSILVQHGTLRVGDYMLAGNIMVKLKPCMMKRIYVTVAGPSTPVSVLGLDGAATAGDKFNILKTKRSETNCFKTFSINA
jgi:translation initiation factor IF-2